MEMKRMTDEGPREGKGDLAEKENEKKTGNIVRTGRGRKF